MCFCVQRNFFIAYLGFEMDFDTTLFFPQKLIWQLYFFSHFLHYVVTSTKSPLNMEKHILVKYNHESPAVLCCVQSAVYKI